MKSPMDREHHHQCCQRALELGRAADPNGLAELIDLLDMPSVEIRRLAASAIGKLAGFGADPVAAVAALAPVALRDKHPQVQQYALKALKHYGSAAQQHIQDLDDLAANPDAKDYVRLAASSSADAIREAVRSARNEAVHRCQRCHARVGADEQARSQKAFQRVFCDRCFDEIYLERRNFDAKVELNKTLRAEDGTLVQSDGERRIADFLSRHEIAFRYDERVRIIEGYAVRPDFYLPEFDLYIEYWGMDTVDYKIGMLKKLKLYQQEGKKLISIYREDKPKLESVLRKKLSQYMTFAHPTDQGDARGKGEATWE